MHVFKECNVVACFWLFSPLGLRARNHGANNMVEWLTEMMKTLQTKQIEVFFVLLWALWVERNKLIWEGGIFDPMRTVHWALGLLEEYQNHHPSSTHKKFRRERVKWVSPPSGRLKMNVDGAYRNDGCGGAGLIVRNEHGSVIGAWSKKLENMNSPLHAETETTRLGLLTALQQGWKNLEVECDCAVLVAALNRQSDVMVEVSRITEDCKVLMNSFENISIRHIYREANGAAHRLAHFASLDRIVELHLGESPVFLQDILYEDKCNALSVTRDRGFMSPSMAQIPINNNNNGSVAVPLI
ncbi:hypothetical protein ACLB2K_005885 [Fragaria x ananassa]